MRIKYLIPSIFLLTLAMPAFSARDKVMFESAKASAKGVMEARVQWIKDKKKKFDFELVLTNLSENGLIVYLHDISCKKGKITGEAKHTFFNTGERTMDFKPGQSKKFKLVCKLHTEEFSDKYFISVRRVSSNPNYDGKTVGKLLAKDLNISIKM